MDVDAPDLPDDELRRRAAGYLGLPPDVVTAAGATDHYHAFAGPERKGERAWALVDRRGALAHAGIVARLLAGSAATLRPELAPAVHRYEQHMGPASVAPPVLAVVGRRLIDCSALTGAEAVVAAVEMALVGAAAAAGGGSGRERAIVAIERDRRH